MRSNAFLLIFCLAALGCSNLKKNAATATPVTPPPPAQTAPAKVAETVNAPSKPEAQAEATSCKRAEETRSLEIEVLQPKGCKLWYSKNGSRTDIASSTKSKTHCETVQKRIQGNLEAANYKCSTGKVSQDKPADPPAPKS